MNKSHEFSHWAGGFKYSPLCQDRILSCGQHEAYQQASELIEELSQIEVSDSTIQRMCVHYGELLEGDLYDADKRQSVLRKPQINPAQASEAQVAYVQFDGGFIFSDADWQEVKLGRVFLASDCRQHTGNKAKGNRIIHSEYAASLGHYSTLTPKLCVLIEEVKQRGAPLVFITDGALWMKNWMQATYPEVVQILDFFHVCEHLGEFAKDVVSQLRKNYQLWWQRQQDDIRAGKIKQVIDRIKGLRITTQVGKQKRTKLLRYFTENQYRMKYKEYEAAGYMIGSGPIEAAHRTVVQKRMKLSGQRWSDNGATPILNLRCARKSGRWQMVRNIIKKAA